MKLYETGTVEFVHERREEINGLFRVIKEAGTKQHLILYARSASCHVIQREYRQLPHPGLFMQTEKCEKQELYVGKLDIEKFYHQLRRL